MSTLTETRPDDAAPEAPAPTPAPADSLLATADHKRLGLLFLGGSLLFLLVGVVVGMILRAELVGEGVQVVAGNYGRLFSMHATVSALLFLGPAWIGLATYVVPLQIGSGRLAFPRLHAFALWLFLLGGALLVTAYLVGPPLGLGITTSRPIAAPRGGSTTAMALSVVAMGVVALSSLLAAVNLVVTVLKLRTPGLTLRRLPLFSWGALVSGLVTLLATPVFLAGLTLFYLDQRFGGGFFQPAHVGGRAVWQHTVWLFGRPEVYLLLLPGLAAACDIVATHARRPLLSVAAARTHIAVFAVLSFGAWAAGTKVADALVLPTYSVLTSLVAVPVGLLVLMWLATLAKGSPRLHTSLLFVAGFVLLTGFGALHAVIAGVVDVHGGAWTTGHLHTVAFGGPTLLVFAAIYHWAPKMTGRSLTPGLGAAAFLGLFGGFFLMGLGSYLLGYDGAPAHVRDFPFSSNTRTFSALATVGAVLIVLGVLAFVADVLRVVAGKGGEPAGDDPYGGLTLEWATSSPPPPQGFDAVPEVRSAHPLLDLRTSPEADHG